MATTPTRQVLQRGIYANDGTGDTLRDAAQKINDNFTQLWEDLYDGVAHRPGRKFVCNSINNNDPDSGGFTIRHDDLKVDSTQIVRISRWDQDDKSFKTNIDSALDSAYLSIWSLDSGTLDDWNLVVRYGGSVQYITANDNWRFTRTSTHAATDDLIDSGGTYYIKIDGVW